MKSIIIGLAAALLVGSPAVAGKLYRCSAQDVVTVEDDGTVGRANRDFWLKANKIFFVDTDTGAIRWTSGKLQTWVVTQKESISNDFVATPLSGLATASTDFIRIRAWATKPGVTFIRFGLSMMITGTCEIVQ